jgi:hypothetical protein
MSERYNFKCSVAAYQFVEVVVDEFPLRSKLLLYADYTHL